MKRMILLIFITASLSAEAATLFPGVTGSALADSVVKYYKSSSNLGYDAGRDTLYGIIDNVGGYLTCVYSGYSIYMMPGQDPSTYAYSNDINCEHTWPQSLGATGLAEGDLHHLYPTEVDVNAARGNLPFGEIQDDSTDRWYYNNSYIKTIPSNNIDLYSEVFYDTSNPKIDSMFEPREDHKGNVARSMFYFFTMYKSQYIALDSDTSFWKEQIDTLFAWHNREPVDARELWRTNKIGTYQQNKPNPFIIDTTLARRIYFPWMNLQEDFAQNETKGRESLAVFDMKEKTLILKTGEENNPIKLTVFNISGSIVFNGKVDSKSISLKDFSNGIYFIKIYEGKKIIFSSKIAIL